LNGRKLPAGFVALLAEWKPFLGVFLSAIVVLILYYNYPPASAIAQQAVKAKDGFGWTFPAVSSVCASILLREFFRLITRTQVAANWRDWLFEVCFFSVVGLLVNALYTMQSIWFGDKTDLATVLIKLAVDQLIFSVLLTVPLSTVLFFWKENQYQWSKVKTAFQNGALKEQYLSLLPTCWFYWGSMLLLVYSVPLDLQFLLYLFAQAGWSLILVRMSMHRKEAAA